MMYVGIGLSIASEEVIARQLLTPAASIVDLLIGVMLLTALILPWRLSVNLPAQPQVQPQPALPPRPM
jgi:hypothetical protein